MARTLRLLALALTLATVGCAHQAERVVLLPQEGRRSALDVTGPDGRTVTLSQPYAEAVVTARETGLAQISAEAVARRYSEVMNAIPMPVKRFSLFFVTGGTELTKESESQIPTILAEVAQAPAAEVLVIGHTDRVGKLEANDMLSLKRAQLVRARLIAVGVPAGDMVAIGRGDREPLVLTADQVASPRNRRVDIKVR
jgi:outer membrane protein OmpA-like peptidoglycan-associated protein